MVKVCSRKTCKQIHTTKFKVCTNCRKANNNSRKRKRENKNIVPKGYRRCSGCFHVKKEERFRSLHSRRTKLTVTCYHCRDINYRAIINPTTKKGVLRELWFEWKRNKTCIGCGETKYIEADHYIGKKVHNCSDFNWWACHGGVQALKKEFAKCQPLCKFCHRLKSHQERRPCKTSFKIKSLTMFKRNIINNEKRKVGCCERCSRKITDENLVGFDWAHTNRAEKTIQISKLPDTNYAYFCKQWPIEKAKCVLLCCNCHPNSRRKFKIKRKYFKLLFLMVLIFYVFF